jgi:hypothetical protein
MIINNKVEIIGNSRNLRHFRERGYTLNVGEKILVDVEDLSSSSTFKVDVKCTICKEEKKITWSAYYKQTNGDENEYYCINCCLIKRIETNKQRYGGNSPTCSNEIVNKIKSTNQERYGNNSSLHGSRQHITDEIFFKKYGERTASNNEDVKAKMKNTFLERYGVDSALKHPDFLEKMKNTNFERWGVDNVSKSETVINKIRDTNLEKYGKEWYYQTEEFKNKSKKTNLERYGSEKYADSIAHKISVINNRINNYPEIEIVDYSKRIFKLKCFECDQEFEISTDLLYKRYKDGRTLCTKCNKLNCSFRSGAEIEIYNFLISKGIKCEYSVRNKIKGELDIFLPEYNVAIEFNGIFWHSEYFKSRNYHLNKYKSCIDKNIKLIQIWEDEWNNQKEQVKSIILSKLGIYENKIYARKCQIKEVDFKTKDNFLNENHLQGSCKSSINLAMFYEDEIVSIMTFGKRRINSKETYELIRFCNSKNTIVIGGASKLFEYFKKNYDISNIVSYSDNNISNGEIYEKLKFEKTNETINYYWCDGKKRYHRFTFNKKRLVSKGNDASKSGSQIMKELGYYRIFGSGIKTWLFKKD